MNNDLYLLAINLTRRCNLACAHCYMAAEARKSGDGDELTSAEVKALLEQVASRSDETMVVLTGGEPLLRRDLETLIAHGAQLGLAMVVGTNGVLLSKPRAAELKEAGAMGVGISLDSLDPASHDGFRGCPGSWEKTLAGMDHCRAVGLPFQIHFSVTDHNAHEVPAMIDFARASGAHVLNIFFLVCTGRGESMSDISPAHYEQVLEQLVEAQSRVDDLVIRARCAPHFKRVAYQRDPESPLTRAQGYEGGGCLAGIHYCRITPQGSITACPYIPEEEGNIRRQGFWQIWDETPGFQQLRNPQLKGKCGECEFRKLCGGCRARPLAMGGTLMDADPWCSHYPGGEAVIEPLIGQQAHGVRWSAEAEARLQRVPGFLRKMVKRRAETHVREQGEAVVTAGHLQALASNHFGDKLSAMRPPAPIHSLAEAGAAPITTRGKVAWTAEAKDYLQSIPAFLRDGVRQVAEEVASSEGRLEVNIKLLRRLEDGDESRHAFPWDSTAEELLQLALSDRAPHVRLFVQPSMEAAAEREVKRRYAQRVTVEDVARVVNTQMAGVQWSAEALSRVQSAPEFVRAGIKKAAEFAARREGLERIESADLTRFRNRAMLRAVKRMKGFDLNSLDFDAFQIARERMPKLKENQQAARRFAEIRRFVESHRKADGSGLGTLGKELLERMKAELRENER